MAHFGKSKTEVGSIIMQIAAQWYSLRDGGYDIWGVGKTHDMRVRLNMLNIDSWQDDSTTTNYEYTWQSSWQRSKINMSNTGQEDYREWRLGWGVGAN